MQEWLNWPAWKASIPQKGIGGSNPPLSAKEEKAGQKPGFLFPVSAKLALARRRKQKNLCTA